MKKVKAVPCLAALCLLGACAQTAQGKLRQAVYDTASAYHLLANPTPDVMAGHVPGVSLSAAQKSLARQASQSVLNELAALEQSIQNNDTLSQTAVAALQADFASFSTCWTGLRQGSTPSSCTTVTTPASQTTTTSAEVATPATTGSN
ncbi:MAG: hypothetical protein ABF436_08815 [Acetobacter okinawensis]|uniref:hypothetical protein n=1 Tax=Acetobacter okinawensis TaxID=1076594 RepID=UPI0039E98BA8